MVAARFVHDGKAIDYTPDSDVVAGQVVVLGDLIGIAKIEIPTGRTGSLALVGVYDVAKATGTGTAIAVGVKAYWDEAESVAKTDDESGANKYLGKTVLAAADDDATVRVRLEQ